MLAPLISNTLNIPNKIINYHFGSPLFADKNTADYLERFDNFRLVHSLDYIPYIYGESMQYFPVGLEEHYAEDGSVTQGERNVQSKYQGGYIYNPLSVYKYHT